MKESTDKSDLIFKIVFQISQCLEIIQKQTIKLIQLDYFNLEKLFNSLIILNRKVSWNKCFEEYSSRRLITENKLNKYDFIKLIISMNEEYTKNIDIKFFEDNILEKFFSLHGFYHDLLDFSKFKDMILSKNENEESFSKYRYSSNSICENTNIDQNISNSKIKDLPELIMSSFLDLVNSKIILSSMIIKFSDILEAKTILYDEFISIILLDKNKSRNDCITYSNLVDFFLFYKYSFDNNEVLIVFNFLDTNKDNKINFSDLDKIFTKNKQYKHERNDILITKSFNRKLIIDDVNLNSLLLNLFVTYISLQEMINNSKYKLSCAISSVNNGFENIYFLISKGKNSINKQDFKFFLQYLNIDEEFHISKLFNKINKNMSLNINYSEFKNYFCFKKSFIYGNSFSINKSNLDTFFIPYFYNLFKILIHAENEVMNIKKKMGMITDFKIKIFELWNKSFISSHDIIQYLQDNNINLNTLIKSIRNFEFQENRISDGNYNEIKILFEDSLEFKEKLCIFQFFTNID